MATPTVTLRLIKRKTKPVYQLDYSINGKRFRVMVGSNKRDAELVRAKIQSDLVLGKHGIPASSAKSLSLADLIKTFLNKKKSRIKESSLTRYGNYYTRIQAFFDGDLVETKRLLLIRSLWAKRSCVDNRPGSSPGLLLFRYTACSPERSRAAFKGVLHRAFP